MQEDSLKISKLTLFSPDFQNLESIPSKFTCDGDDVNPNLEISGVAEEAKSLILIMEDLDAPDETWDHWIKFNIPVDTRNINEGEEIQGISGEGTGGSLDYAGPCPPEGKHRYVFKLYSIDVELVLAEGSSKVEVKEAIEGHILQEAELTGVYQREEEIKIPSED
ncbi:MAG: YbhB/YbcL family Raf kinase inhibitor-like protein [Candidatus Pacebacteria bacterium]|nr:YbhB/YbcL family Raf kinase inhibitor-like protein [Candidatus Paceibacterota bacterium]